MAHFQIKQGQYQYWQYLTPTKTLHNNTEPSSASQFKYWRTESSIGNHKQFRVGNGKFLEFCTIQTTKFKELPPIKVGNKLSQLIVFCDGGDNKL